jgi:hypothetical protein
MKPEMASGTRCQGFVGLGLGVGAYGAAGVGLSIAPSRGTGPAYAIGPLPVSLDSDDIDARAEPVSCPPSKPVRDGDSPFTGGPISALVGGSSEPTGTSDSETGLTAATPSPSDWTIWVTLDATPNNDPTNSPAPLADAFASVPATPVEPPTGDPRDPAIPPTT